MPAFPQRRIPPKIPKPRQPVAGKKPRLALQVAKWLDAFSGMPEGVLTASEQTILRRVQDIHTGAVHGRLTTLDLQNMQKIAKKYRLKP